MTLLSYVSLLLCLMYPSPRAPLLASLLVLVVLVVRGINVFLAACVMRAIISFSLVNLVHHLLLVIFLV